HLGQGGLARRQGDDVAALDEPDVRVVRPAGDLLVLEDLKQLRVERPLEQHQGQAPGAALFCSVIGRHRVRALSRREASSNDGEREQTQNETTRPTVWVTTAT